MAPPAGQAPSEGAAQPAAAPASEPPPPAAQQPQQQFVAAPPPVAAEPPRSALTPGLGIGLGVALLGAFLLAVGLTQPPTNIEGDGGGSDPLGFFGFSSLFSGSTDSQVTLVVPFLIAAVALSVMRIASARWAARGAAVLLAVVGIAAAYGPTAQVKAFIKMAEEEQQVDEGSPFEPEPSSGPEIEVSAGTGFWLIAAGLVILAAATFLMDLRIQQRPAPQYYVPQEPARPAVNVQPGQVPPAGGPQAPPGGGAPPA